MGKIPSRTKPTFADEVMVSFVIKSSKDSKRRDAVVRMGFVDSLRKEIVSDVVVSPVTAEAMISILQVTVKKMNDSLAGKIEKKAVEESANYIG
jgi:uncharacterized protein (UPF0264 family)